ncbi:MAG: RIP metalloprotease RseP [Dehalococcoidales bacterium]|nr:RIP metalloprotease RseP [Dehalococcoidales bacterium]
MSAFIAIIAFLIILVILVVAHELGHFLTAKSRGVQVTEFGIGFPPRIWGIKRGETLYSVNALPLGGFVKLAGEEDPRVPGSLASKGYGTRLLVLSAGSIMNLLLPFVILSIAFMIPHNVYVSPVVIEEVAENSPAAAAGLHPGDTVLSVNDNIIANSADLQRHVQLNLGKEIEFTVRHADSTTETIQVTPRWRTPPGQGATGIVMSRPAEPPTVVSRSEPVWRAVPLGVNECVETLVLFKNEIIRWFIGAAAPQLTGPVGMAEITGEVVQSGFSTLLQFAAFLSINLGIINLLPLPALDGGRIAFVLLEMVRGGRRVSPKVEGYIHLIGFMLLIGLMVLVTYGDIFNIITTGSALPVP